MRHPGAAGETAAGDPHHTGTLLTAAGGEGGDVDGGGEGGGDRVPSEVGEAWLPFMESTSACLAAHEQQIEALQVCASVGC